MKKLNWMTTLVIYSCSQFLHATPSQPTFSVIPTTPTQIQIPSFNWSPIVYKVINNTKITRTLTMVPIEGITQVTGVGMCNGQFTLQPGASCLLTLQFNDAFPTLTGIKGGPVVCKANGNGGADPNLCSQPSKNDSLYVEYLTQGQFLPWDVYYGAYYTIPSWITTTPEVGNLLNYTITFPLQSFWYPVTGFTDENGIFMTYGGTVITNPEEIANILSTATRVSVDNFGNANDYGTELLAYQTPDYQLIYADRFGRYLLSGIVVGYTSSGVTLSMTSYINTLPDSAIGANGSIPSTVPYSAVQAVPNIQEGNPYASKTLYSFTDPNCAPCQEFRLSCKPYIQNGTLSAHWMFDSFLFPNSQGKALAILSGQVPPGADPIQYPPTPLGALSYNDDFFVFSPVEQGGIPPTTNPSQYAVDAFNASQQASYNFFGIYANPAIVYINTQGQTVVTFGADCADLINDIQG